MADRIKIDQILTSSEEETSASDYALFAHGELCYFDFEATEKKKVNSTDYTWYGTGREVLETLIPTSGELLTDLITYHYYVGQTGMEEDDMSVRRAIWYYVQLLFGLIQDFYDYGEVNVMLSIPAKTYIKKVACYPHLVTEEDIEGVM